MVNVVRQQPENQRTAEFLALNRVFTLDEFAHHLGGEFNLAQYRVRYHLRQGRIKRLANGVYATVPFGVGVDTFEPDVFLVAAAIRKDAIFSYHSALDLLGQGHSVWWTCTVCTGNPRPPVRVGRNTIKFLSRPRPIEKLEQEARANPPEGWPWTTEVSRGGRRLVVTTPERTLVDGFRELSLVGGLDELVESMDGFATLSPERLRQLLQTHGNRRLWAAVGWYLQRRLRDFFLTESVLDQFRAHRPRSRAYLVPGQRGGVLAREWNLLVPEHLASRARTDNAGP